MKGNVFELNEKGQKIPLTGANVYWLGSFIGASTNEKGSFVVPRLDTTTKLVVSFIGYQNDTVETWERNNLNVTLKRSLDLEEVTITHRTKTTELTLLDPVKVEKIGEKELLKAACCNLSESFETSPSVDVSFTDAITGSRQIQMLGLAGQYTLITRENMTEIKGLTSVYGLTFTPGTWIEGIQMSKGSGTVTSGYESISGHINIELRKPESADRFNFNLYGNEGGRMEANAIMAKKINPKWSTSVLLHGKNNTMKWDRNNDGFVDHPLGNALILMNRWKYIGENGLRFQFGLKSTMANNTGGQVQFSADDNNNSFWGYTFNARQIGAWGKVGYVNDNKPWQSIGLQISASGYQQESMYGLKDYDADQNSLYTNLIYNGIVSNTFHTIKLGLSFSYDDFSEYLTGLPSYNYTETVPGSFIEYTYKKTDKFNLVSGMRADYHNIYGIFLTPRGHVRYAFTDDLVLRFSAGRGLKTAYVFAENSGVLASSRLISILGANNKTPFGLEPEIAWNYGVNITKKFNIDFRQGDISLDFYRTDFTDQVIIDLEQSAREARIYNLDGQSYSNSFQVTGNYELIKRFDLRLAYRLFDVKTTYSGELLSKPLIARHRAFMNVMYETRKHWKFDYTLNWQGKKRIPFTGDNPVEYQMDRYSPDFFVMNAQISKTWLEKLEVYIGGENLANITQKKAIIASEDPFGEYFDSSMIWGNIFGRNLYAGIRYRLK